MERARGNSFDFFLVGVTKSHACRSSMISSSNQAPITKKRHRVCILFLPLLCGALGPVLREAQGSFWPLEPERGLYSPACPQEVTWVLGRYCLLFVPKQSLLTPYCNIVKKFSSLEQISSIWIMSWISSGKMRLSIAFVCRLFFFFFYIACLVEPRIILPRWKWIHLQSIIGWLVLVFLGKMKMCTFYPIILIHQLQIIWFC